MGYIIQGVIKMGLRGPKATSTDSLIRRGSRLAKGRVADERELARLQKEQAELDAGPIVTDQLIVAIKDKSRHQCNYRDISVASGVSIKTISKFVNDKTNLSGDTFSRLAYVLDLKLVWSDGTEIE